MHDCGVILGCNENQIANMIASFTTTINNPDKINPALYLNPVHYVYTSDGTFTGRTKRGEKIKEKPGTYHIIHIHVPIAPNVIRNAGRIYDRNGDADVDITNFSDVVFQCYARKQSTYFVNKVFPHWKVDDLRGDLIVRARQMATARRKRNQLDGPHPWESMDDEEMLRTSNLILTGGQASGQASGQVENQAILISLDIEKLNALIDYCSEPRTRSEMQEFCGIKSRDYFRTKILVPMILSHKVFLTIPEKPSSPKQHI